MATSKANKAAKKRIAKVKSKATRKKAKPNARKKTNAKRAKIKKKVAKKTPRKRVAKPARAGLKKGAHDPKLNRTADGLRKGSVQASIVEMARRKKGVRVAELIKKHGTTDGSVRVNVSLLKKAGFALTIDRSAYKLR